jgi:hypothetical protein
MKMKQAGNDAEHDEVVSGKDKELLLSKPQAWILSCKFRRHESATPPTHV